MYTNGDEIIYAATGQYGIIIDDSRNDDGIYEIRLDTGEEYTVDESELA